MLIWKSKTLINVLSIQSSTVLPKDSDLFERLIDEPNQRVLALSNLPLSIIDYIEQEHQLEYVRKDENKIYTSELMQQIIRAKEEGSQLIYVPISEENIPSIVMHEQQEYVCMV